MREDPAAQPRIDRSVTIRAPIDQVWSAVSTADGLETWLGGEVELDPRPGRPVLVRWPDRSTNRGLVELVEPCGRFVFRWRRITGAGLTLHVGEPTRVEIVLTTTGDDTTRVDIVESPAPLPGKPVSLTRVAVSSTGKGAA